MFWRIVGAVLSLTFFASSFSIWGDPTCRSVTMHGGRFGIAYTCLESTGGASANGFAWVMFFIGLILLVFNLWPYIRVWFYQAQSKLQDSQADIQRHSVSKSKSDKTMTYQLGSQQRKSKGSVRPTSCPNCEKKLNKTSKFCQNCGEQVNDSELFPDERSDKPKRSSGKSEEDEFKNVGAFALIGLIIAIVIVAFVLTTRNSLVASPTSPTETPGIYTRAEVLAQAGEGFQYVNDGFAMKWDDSERGCTGLTACVLVKVYSIKECTQLKFSLIFKDSANTVLGKEFQTGSFGLAAGETAIYELEALDEAQLVFIDDITCALRP
jgi:hypothetical protein